jgi:hypothetical protein
MSRIHVQSRTILSAAALAATLLGTACSDSTAPSAGVSSAGHSEATPVPTDTTGTSAGSPDQLPKPEAGEAPKVNWPAPGDSAASSQKPSLATQVISPATEWARIPGLVMTQPIACLGSGSTRLVSHSGMLVGRTGDRSVYFDQYVSGRVWFYRWNASTRTWVAQGRPAVTDARLPYPMLNATLPEATYRPTTAGLYKVMVQLTWYAFITDGRGWVRTAWSNVYFNSTSDYAGFFNATAYPGYCGIS